MGSIEHKLRVLSDIAHILNKNGVVWAVGASMLLYFKKKTDCFNDIDIMVVEDDVEKIKELLLPMGIMAPPNPNKQYRTRHFLEFTIHGVDVDVMAGFVIVKNEIEYDCSLHKEQIAEYIQVNDESIPLQSLKDWRYYYELMGRTQKVEMIDK